MSLHGILGESTDYPKSYAPDILYAIPRALGRTAIADQQSQADIDLSIGMDWWHAFEVSWLNLNGISQVAVARFSVPANSPNIVESKSLKLYLNSLNFTEFADSQMLLNVIAKDLSNCVGAKVGVELFNVSDIDETPGLFISMPQGQCIDTALDAANEKITLVEHPDASLLESSLFNGELGSDRSDNLATDEPREYKWYSNLLRSNCPVTNQPDWGTLAIEMTTYKSMSKAPINEANLLKYILSFRQHNGFHEQCVERIYADLTQAFCPLKLMVRAWYTRRGGIDINPCRVSDIGLLPAPSRLIRQ